MADRKMLSIEEILLVGGSLCLDFVNTTGARSSEKARDRIRSYNDLLIWARRTGLLTKEEAVELRAEADRRSGEAQAALKLALQIREALYDVLRPLAEVEHPDAEKLSALDVLLLKAARRRTRRIGPGGVNWSWSREPEELGWFLWPIVHSVDGRRFIEAQTLRRMRLALRGRDPQSNSPVVQEAVWEPGARPTLLPKTKEDLENPWT